MSIELIFVFNHRFEENLSKLRDLYSDRFTKISFLMPFPRGHDKDVIPVYDSSYRFHNFFSAAWEQLRRSAADHFVFMGDDFILNPTLNEKNLAVALGLDARTGFISDLKSVTRASANWWRLRTVRRDLRYAGDCFAWRDELPPSDEAVRIFERHGLDTDDLRWSPRHNERGILPVGRGMLQWIKTTALLCYLGRKLEYPLAWGYSDFIIVPRLHMEKFSKNCQVLSAMGIFVESAAPTALVLSVPAIVTEERTHWRSTIKWGSDCKKLLESVGSTKESLIQSFLPNELGKHPVKLSRIDF